VLEPSEDRPPRRVDERCKGPVELHVMVHHVVKYLPEWSDCQRATSMSLAPRALREALLRIINRSRSARADSARGIAAAGGLKPQSLMRLLANLESLSGAVPVRCRNFEIRSPRISTTAR
jgi:hypothetical protein